MSVPPERVQACNVREVAAGDYVLYWMVANRRRHFNFALQRAVEWSVELRKPLLIVEALGCRHRWATARSHVCIMQGMLDNARAFRGSGVAYHPYVERRISDGKGMIHALAEHSSIVVTDDFPAFEIPRWIEAVASRAPVPVERVDSNGLLPMRSTDRIFLTAHSFRRFLQARLRPHLNHFPLADPLAEIELPKPLRPSVLQRWPGATLRELASPAELAARLPIDQSVALVATFAGGAVAARKCLQAFLDDGLDRYAEGRNDPDDCASSGLSPYLHFGHISTHEIFSALAARAKWSTASLRGTATGCREGWWGADANVDAFLDQLVTWREIGFNMCVHAADYDSYESLPEWARKTLALHAGDPRPALYSPEQLERARTHDRLWNAAQRQLLTEGIIQNYLRMLWGKKILEWSPTPRDAVSTMIELNNKYALDGRDPNSSSGIFWILGRYDRPWGPDRPIFGTVRYMSSDNTARKFRVRNYLEKYARGPGVARS
jgi:deoxyribodipyrimidine photo-lyase